MEHLFYEKMPEGIKYLYYKGKRITRKEFIELKEKSLTKGNSKINP